MPGILCINADFEMAWSGRRVPDDPARDALFEGTGETVERLLALFDRYEIPITWATVGALMLTRPFDFGRLARFNRADPFFTGDWYAPPPFGSPRAKHFYAPRLIERILSAKTKHEIGCHTFTHIYLGAGSVSEERFRMELEACAEAARDWNLTPETFVYPSQYVEYTGILPEYGYRVYRQESLEWFRFGKPYIPSFDIRLRDWPRKIATGLGKWTDERFCFRPACFAPERRAGGLTRITTSTFFPGYFGISKYVTSAQRARRLSKGIDRAVEENGVFTFSFHPWQLNRRREECLDALERICSHAARCREAQGLKIVPARDLAVPEPES